MMTVYVYLVIGALSQSSKSYLCLKLNTKMETNMSVPPGTRQWESIL